MKEILELFAITHKLKEKYKSTGRDFTPDGKLVGDIGEVLAAEMYGLRLLKKNTRIYDAEEKKTGRKVQIKSTFKGYCYFPFGENSIPDYFLSVRILEDGKLLEIFNGRGQYVVDHYIKARGIKAYKESYYTLSIGVLKELNKKVPAKDRIEKVKGAGRK